MNIFNIFHTLYFNFRYLPLRQAVHLPVRVTNDLCIEKLHRGQIVIEDIAKGKIQIGRGKSPGLQAFRSRILIGNGSKIVFRGKAIISQGTVLRCDKNSSIEFGNNFYCNSNCYIRSTSKISFGDNCALGWNITLNTSDGHPIWHHGEKVIGEGPIIVGDNVWITSDASLLKGSVISNHCIVAQKAVVTQAFSEEHCLIGGIPAKVVAHNIDWSAK